ncbi:hypothetical protein Btru_077792 [Bulinus truncatus]|nr:hypothetical protein Btru_077792 [Bulinus truncatus]
MTQSPADVTDTASATPPPPPWAASSGASQSAPPASTAENNIIRNNVLHYAADNFNPAISLQQHSIGDNSDECDHGSGGNILQTEHRTRQVYLRVPRVLHIPTTSALRQATLEKELLKTSRLVLKSTTRICHQRSEN